MERDNSACIDRLPSMRRAWSCLCASAQAPG